MPEHIFALFGHREDQRDQVQRMFLDAGMIDLLVEPPAAGLSKIELPNEEAAQRLKLAAVANGLNAPQIHRYLKPTSKELEAAPLLVLRAGGPGAERGHPRAGTTYDDRKACAQCGAGLIQTSPLRVRKSELPKTYLAGAIGDELLLHESIAGEMETSKLRGVLFREVHDADGKDTPWRQLVIEHTLPPMLASTRGLIRGRASAEAPCAKCGRDGWFDTVNDPFIPVYARSALDAMPDVAWAHELMGTGAWAEPVHGKRWLARRRLVVRPSVYALLKRLKVRGLVWMPGRVEM